jgi:hypothetical protein
MAQPRLGIRRHVHQSERKVFQSGPAMWIHLWIGRCCRVCTPSLSPSKEALPTYVQRVAERYDGLQSCTRSTEPHVDPLCSAIFLAIASYLHINLLSALYLFDQNFRKPGNKITVYNGELRQDSIFRAALAQAWTYTFVGGCRGRASHIYVKTRDGPSE